jgi:hypothetical protein
MKEEEMKEIKRRKGKGNETKTQQTFCLLKETMQFKLKKS